MKEEGQMTKDKGQRTNDQERKTVWNVRLRSLDGEHWSSASLRHRSSASLRHQTLKIEHFL